jgi:hypothetical protein
MNWVKCSDRLPEHLETVLFSDSKKVYSGYLLRPRFEDDDYIGWFCSGDFPIDGVTHWMPLPEVPNETI